MVGTGPGGRRSALARCSIVGYGGDVLYDRYVRPAAPVVDFRTRWSGVRRQHMARAVPFVAARKEVRTRRGSGLPPSRLPPRGRSVALRSSLRGAAWSCVDPNPLPQILRILAGKLVVGHAIYNDFKALKYFHPQALTRDTSKMPLLNRKGGFPENATVSLKRLAKELLHKDIQVGKSGHSSVEDARTTMELYKVVEVEWEQHLLLTPKQE
ncbi:hypothetical protein AAES_139615 [Amazona aestiva]|uniref:Exonuclease domain-containing protein n=1 Tax=Amazona aestiva TaxID=12930 RepID=A0A0Q3M021_AMAAE|nr:hypothetical protein AAES_139615 [Amazona aestiva]